MTIDQFNVLSRERRTDLYLRFPPFIAAHETNEHLCLLYRYKDVYVEVMFGAELVLENIEAIAPEEAAARYGIPVAQAANT